MGRQEETSHSDLATPVALYAQIAETFRLMAFDLKEIIASRLGENCELHEKHLHRTLVQAQHVIGFDKVYHSASRRAVVHYTREGE